MKIQQLSIFLENRTGTLSRIATILGENQINIRAMSLADTSDFGVLRLIVGDTSQAKAILKNLGFAVSVTEVVAVRIADRPGALGQLLGVIEQAGLNVEYVYGYVEKIEGQAVLIFQFSDLDQAIEILQAGNITVLEDSRS